jgi:hypothetical protein
VGNLKGCRNPEKKVMSNATLANLDQSPVPASNMVPSCRDIVSPTTNKVRGTKFLFACNETPLELKERLKASGLKGRALSNKISAIRRGDESLAWVQTQTFMEGMRKEGFLPVQADQLSKSAVLRFVKVEEEKESKSTISKTLEQAVRNLMAKIDCSYDEALAYVS